MSHCFLSGKRITPNMSTVITERVAGGNYKTVDVSVLTDGYKVNIDVPMTVTHETGRTISDINARVKITGTATIEGIANLAVYCKFKNWYFETDGENYTIMGGKANKFHGMTSLFKRIKKYSTIDRLTASLFNHYSGDYIGTINLKGSDPVKTLQDLFERGYDFHMITDREDFIV